MLGLVGFKTAPHPQGLLCRCRLNRRVEPVPVKLLDRRRVQDLAHRRAPVSSAAARDHSPSRRRDQPGMFDRRALRRNPCRNPYPVTPCARQHSSTASGGSCSPSFRSGRDRIDRRLRPDADAGGRLCRGGGVSLRPSLAGRRALRSPRRALEPYRCGSVGDRNRADPAARPLPAWRLRRSGAATRTDPLR